MVAQIFVIISKLFLTPSNFVLWILTEKYNMKKLEHGFFGVCLTKLDKYMVKRLPFGMKL